VISGSLLPGLSWPAQCERAGPDRLNVDAPVLTGSMWQRAGACLPAQWRQGTDGAPGILRRPDPRPARRARRRPDRHPQGPAWQLR